MAVLVSCDNSVACVVDPDTGLMMTPLEAVLGPMIEDAQKAAQAPVAAPPAAGEIELFGVRIKRPQIPSPESVAESAKEYAKEQEVARAKNDAAEEAAKQQPGAAKEWFDKKGWADRIRKLKPW